MVFLKLGSLRKPHRWNESVPMQLAQCWFPWLAVTNAKLSIYFKVKYTEAILSNNTRNIVSNYKNADCSLKK